MSNTSTFVSVLPLATPSQAAETPCFCTLPYTGEHEAVRTPCGHIFARPCLAQWCGTHVQRNANKCPTCRAVLFEEAEDDEPEPTPFELDGVPVTAEVYFAYVRDVLERFRLFGERLAEVDLEIQRGAGEESGERGEERVEIEPCPEEASIDEQEEWFDRLWERAPGRG